MKCDDTVLISEELKIKLKWHEKIARPQKILEYKN